MHMYLKILIQRHDSLNVDMTLWMLYQHLTLCHDVVSMLFQHLTLCHDVVSTLFQCSDYISA
jgi:hypothetical protein